MLVVLFFLRLLGPAIWKIRFLHATLFDGVQRDVIVVESVWPNAAFEEGIGINALISAEPGAPNGGAVFHDTAVWISKLD